MTWRVQVDGVDGHLPAHAETATARCHVNRDVGWTGRQRGPAYCRTVGLLAQMAHGSVTAGADDVVVTIDADDLWLPGGLTQLVQPLATHPSTCWVASGNTWLDEDGHVINVCPPDGLAGPVEPGTVRAQWERTGTFPVTASVAAYRMNVVLAGGGWPASPSGEDAVLLLSISDRHAGWAVPDALFGYRQHSAQTTRSPEHASLREWTHVLMRSMAPPHPAAGPPARA